MATKTIYAATMTTILEYLDNGIDAANRGDIVGARVEMVAVRAFLRKLCTADIEVETIPETGAAP